MNIKELAEAVTEETGRIELTSMINRVVRATVIKAHELEYFQKDLIQETLQGLTPESTTLIMNLPPRWRKFAALRLVNSSGAPITQNLKYREIDDIFTADGYLEPNIYYISGAGFVMNTSEVVENLYSSYWQYPDVGSEVKTTWITERYFQHIIDGASVHIYRKVNDVKSARMHQALWDEGIRDIIVNNIISGD